jgi:hypothetical protein
MFLILTVTAVLATLLAAAVTPQRVPEPTT